MKEVQKTTQVSLLILAGVATAGALIYTRAVMVPFVISLFLYFVISPGMKWLEKRLHVSKTFAMILSALAFLLTAALLFFLIYISVQRFVESAPLYRDRVLEFVGWGTTLLGKLDLSLDTSSLRETVRNLPLFSMAQNLSGAILSILGNAALVVIFVLFLILGEGSRKSTSTTLEEVGQRISRYVSTKAFTSFLTAFLVGIILLLFGVEMAFMFAVITLFLNFIPSIGSVVATLIPLPVVFLQFGFGGTFIVVFILTGLVQFGIGNVLEPKMMGENLDLHPVTVLVFLMFWGFAWGVAGMFLAVPITVVLKIILNRIPSAQPLAELMAGRISSSS